VLGSAGDSFAEFNCGGIAVICGINAKTPKRYRLSSLRGYGRWNHLFRGPTDDSYSRNNSRIAPPTDEQWQWLEENMPAYLSKIERDDLKESLLVRDEWQILNAVSPQERALLFSGPMPMAEFRNKHWNKAFGGGDPLRDLAPGLDRSPIGAVPTGDMRRKKPSGQPRISSALYLLLPGAYSHC